MTVARPGDEDEDAPGRRLRDPLSAAPWVLCTQAFAQGFRSLIPPHFLFQSQDVGQVAKAAVLGLQLFLPHCRGQVPDTTLEGS